MRQGLLLLLLVLILFGCVGCGSTGDVSGTVSYHGKPVVCGNVLIMGEDGLPHRGKLQPDGSFEVKNVPVGTAMVAVCSVDRRGQIESTRNQMKSKQLDTSRLPDYSGWFPIPKKYMDPYLSQLRCEVHPGDNTYDINLTGEVRAAHRSPPGAPVREEK